MTLSKAGLLARGSLCLAQAFPGIAPQWHDCAHSPLTVTGIAKEFNLVPDYSFFKEPLMEKLCKK